MQYHYPNTVVIICENTDVYTHARNLMVNPFTNAIPISATARAEKIHTEAHKDAATAGQKQQAEKQLVRAHAYLVNSLQNADYYVMDIQKAMLKTEVNKGRFNVVLVNEKVLPLQAIVNLKAKKIYLYEDRDEGDRPKKENYTDDESDFFQPLGFSGSLVNITQSTEAIYKNLGFEV